MDTDFPVTHFNEQFAIPHKLSGRGALDAWTHAYRGSDPRPHHVQRKSFQMAAGLDGATVIPTWGVKEGLHKDM